MTLHERIEQFEGDFLKFHDVENPRHPVPDICAFLMLADLDVLSRASGGPTTGKPMDIVACAEHDEIWLNVDCEQLAERANDAILRDLVRCGVRYDESTDSLAMFV